MSTRTRKKRPISGDGDMAAEPTQRAKVAGARRIPAARSWIDTAKPVHHQLVRALLHEMPDGRVTRVTGWGPHASAWAVCHDHGGFWEIPYDEAAAQRDLDAARGRDRAQLGPGRRAVRAVVVLAVLLVAAWTANILLDASHATDETRQGVGICSAAVVFLVGVGLILRARRNGGRP